MSNYHHLKDLAPRDIISRAIFAEQKKGQVYLDITQKTKSELKKHFPTIYKYLAENGYAMEKDLIPVAPAAHYTCGGVVTDLHGKTNIKNLFVVGEAACTGLHGANRLASNSLLEAAVMSEHVMDSPLPESKDFEEQMKKYSIQKEKTSNTNTKTQNQKILKKITKKDLNKISQLRKKLQEVMWKNAGIIRTEKMLKIGLLKIEQIKRSTGWITPSTKKIELENMIIISQIIISAALKRKKSLGAHRRLN
jgi:L-aspartate oxidase